MTFPSYIAALLTAVALLLTACERPFIEPERPDIEIVSPDLSTIFPNTKLQLQVRASGQRSIQHVELNGDSLTFDPEQQLWVFDYALRFGLNRLVFAATDADDRTTFDTVYAMHGTFTIERNMPRLPQPRGGQTATLLDDGRLIILGGTRDVGSEAYTTGLTWSLGDEQFQPLNGSMGGPRTGHTATLLPDGRILILGGASREPLDDLQNLVETVEIFDPADESFRPIAFEGDPIRRAFHTASLHRSGDQIFIDLFGGRGDVRYRPTPELGVRQDLRRFVFRNDSLLALSPAPGPAFDYGMWGHSGTVLDRFEQGASRRYLISGTHSAGTAEQPVAFRIGYDPAVGILQEDTGVPNQARRRHASALIADRFVGVFGGFGQSRSAPLNDVEIYAGQAGRFFIFPESNVLLRRYGLTATNLPDGRILLVGGYFSAGQGSDATSAVRIPFL